MDVRCPACAARYTVKDEKIRGKTARMRCRACETVWLVSGPAAAEASPSPSERRAAVVRRGAERERRDLFASQPPDQGSYRQTLRPPPGVAARNESSVLFTVDSLRGAPRVNTPQPEPMIAGPASGAPGSVFNEEEGVIDLKALSSAPPRPGPRAMGPVFGNAALGNPALGSEPPPGAFAREVGASGALGAVGARRFSKGLIAGVAAAAVAVVLTGFGLAATFQTEEPVPRLTAAIVQAPPPEAEPVPAPATEGAEQDDEADGAKAPAVGVSSKAHTKHKARRHHARKHRRHHAHKSKHHARKPAHKKHKKRKAADPCHCHGDFSCILRCEAKGK